MLEVRAAAAALPEEPLLLLYFESRRRSGGGPVRSCHRRGPRLLLTFESPCDAQNVLSRRRHQLQGVELLVRPAAPWDPRKLLLRGLDPRTGRHLLELYVENALRRDSGAYSLRLGPARRRALVQLAEPLGEAEFAAVEQRVRRRRLEGAAVAVERVQQTDSVVVRSESPRLSCDLLELYFENRRSGGGSVQHVRVLPGCSLAVVSFQDPAAVERVLQQPHRLQDMELEVSPYYEFLEEEEEDEASGALREAEPAAPATQEICLDVADAAKLQLLELSPVLGELHAAFPGLALRVEGSQARLSGGDAARLGASRKWLQEKLEGAVQEPLPFPAQTLCLLRRRDVRERLERLLASRGVPACYAVAESEVVLTALSPEAVQDAVCLLHSALSPFCLELAEQELAALSSPRWAQLRDLLRCCDVRLVPGTGCLQGLTLHGLEQENREKLRAFLRDAAQDEALVSMEPGMLRYLQQHYQELLAGIAEVSLLPLEGSDVTGFRLSGEASACRAAADFLQSLLGTVGSQTVTLRYPGVARFLLDERGQSIVRELESRFQCVIDLSKVAWSPPDPQPELAELLPESEPWDSPPAALGWQHQELPDGTDADGQSPNIEEIRELLAALRTDGDGEPPPPALDEAAPGWSGAGSDGAEDLHGVPETGSAAPGELRGPADGGDAAEEEEAAMLLAIQRSLESTGREEEELQRATLLSLRSYEREQRAAPGPAEDAGLRAALEASLEEALPAADAARVTLYAALEWDTSALPRQLEQALEGRLRAEEVQSPRLRVLPAACRRELARLQRAHAVHLRLRGGTATLRGFADYPAGAARDLRQLLARLPPLEAEPPAPGSARWVRWDAGGTAVPYAAPAAALLERAWRRRQRRLDVLLDGRAVAVDLERMEEYDVGAARALPICRSEPPAGVPAAGLEAAGPGEAVALVPLAEGSEEFGEAARHFYGTLGDLRGRVHVVKVEKLIHPLLYKQYQLKKASMERAGGGRPVERVLFHGTTEQSSREICLHGFNRSFCGKNAALYGLGVYFAVHAALSAQEQYSPRSADGSKYIFVAKALTGDYAVGAKDLRAPPLKEGAEAPLRYDSVVDNPREPSIFVIFNDTQAYPQYLITCRHA
ncbi:protein mono-ADP-ribosyltransferase PARP10 isoform X8 [Struthio camelus]|uniref:protein mono-ADP-ribosyltransferase PARP10 isoform X1 n=1 Tax=Struthio camelus TaxID=8801 RepID=UPI003603BB72